MCVEGHGLERDVLCCPCRRVTRLASGREAVTSACTSVASDGGIASGRPVAPGAPLEAALEARVIRPLTRKLASLLAEIDSVRHGTVDL